MEQKLPEPLNMKDMKNRKYITINEAVEICGVTRRTIYNWLTEGFLDYGRTPSGSIRIDKICLINKSNHRRANLISNLNQKGSHLKNEE
jgi:hypothetical protein